jgi:NAD(P)-dependent dehydrogenase (short-subunit alcohol dehydrogenase family)
MSFSLKGKTALVTGSSRGIGRELISAGISYRLKYPALVLYER